MKTQNKLEATGRIKGIRRGITGYPELLVYMNEKGRDTELNFVMSTPLDPDIAQGDLVSIKGRFKSKDIKLDDGNWKDIQILIADSVTPAKTEMEETMGIRGHFVREFYMRGYIVGAIVSIYESPNDSKLCTLTVATGSRTGRDTIKMTYSKNSRLPAPSQLKIGDEVAVIVKMGSTLKMKEGKIKKYENIYLQDLVILKEGDGENIPELEDASQEADGSFFAESSAKRFQTKRRDNRKAEREKEENKVPVVESEEEFE